MAKDPRIDAYIAKSQPFAQPILARIREVFHEAVPGIEEAIKWGVPAFVHKGKNLGGMAGFKEHTALMIAYAGRVGDGMGGYGKIASLDELPPREELIAQIRQGAAEIEAGKKPEWSKKSPPKPVLPVPQDLEAALREVPAAQAAFEAFPPSQKREYIVWITEAKADATRERRLAQAIEWIAEGKYRNWKYMR
jgi:uncharacterized protein YdeI (YjbR/CyaY-like superfamily)